MGFKRLVGLVAILAIALQAVLPTAAVRAASFDPLTAICHSGVTAAPTDAAPGTGDTVPAWPCDHCTLCVVTVFALILDNVPAGRLRPPRVLVTLQPESMDARFDFHDVHHSARGPPHLS